MQRPELFTPIQLGGITLPNRIVISPMCQYSADDGCMNDWHLVHLGHLAYSGAGLMILEMTQVTREGRISHGCAGLYSDHNETALRKILSHVRSVRADPIGIQLGHAGRKGSAQVPWQGRAWLTPEQSPWQTVAPSPIAHGEGWPAPRELTTQEVRGLVDAFASAAERAKRVGLDLVELHAAHGYLLHQFLSPLANQRKDAYGQNRMKLPLDVAKALRDIWPRERALGARITANDWMPGGLGPEDAVPFARELERLGYDYVCVSSGALVPQAKIPVAPGYQVPFAEKVKKATRLKIQTVGMIADPEQAEAILREGRADMIVMARAFLDNPRWAWHAAERFGVKLDYPPQYQRSRHDLWPGAAVARPRSEVG